MTVVRFPINFPNRDAKGYRPVRAPVGHAEVVRDKIHQCGQLFSV